MLTVCGVWGHQDPRSNDYPIHSFIFFFSWLQAETSSGAENSHAWWTFNSTSNMGSLLLILWIFPTSILEIISCDSSPSEYFVSNWDSSSFPFVHPDTIDFFHKSVIVISGGGIFQKHQTFFIIMNFVLHRLSMFSADFYAKLFEDARMLHTHLYHMCSPNRGTRSRQKMLEHFAQIIQGRKFTAIWSFKQDFCVNQPVSTSSQPKACPPSPGSRPHATQMHGWHPWMDFNADGLRVSSTASVASKHFLVLRQYVS